MRGLNPRTAFGSHDLEGCAAGRGGVHAGAHPRPSRRTTRRAPPPPLGSARHRLRGPSGRRARRAGHSLGGRDSASSRFPAGRTFQPLRERVDALGARLGGVRVRRGSRCRTAAADARRGAGSRNPDWVGLRGRRRRRRGALLPVRSVSLGISFRARRSIRSISRFIPSAQSVWRCRRLVLLHAGVIWAAALVIRIADLSWRRPRSTWLGACAAGAWAAGTILATLAARPWLGPAPAVPLAIAIAAAGACAVLLTRPRGRVRRASQVARLHALLSRAGIAGRGDVPLVAGLRGRCERTADCHSARPAGAQPARRSPGAARSRPRREST